MTIVTTGTGLQYEDVVVGDGAEASQGQSVCIDYTGTLYKSGKHFDSSIGRTPSTFRLGAGEVIKGWDEGVKGMRAGGRRLLTIPPELGYGSRGYPPMIPGNSTLCFDVELVSVS